MHRPEKNGQNHGQSFMEPYHTDYGGSSSYLVFSAVMEPIELFVSIGYML